MSDGRYKPELLIVRERTASPAVLVIVLDGDRGDGFECIMSPALHGRRLVDLLRCIAADIEASIPPPAGTAH